VAPPQDPTATTTRKRPPVAFSTAVPLSGSGRGLASSALSSAPDDSNNNNKDRPAAELLAEAHALASRGPPAAALPALRALAPELARAAPSLSPSQLAALLPALARAGLSDAALRDAACAAVVSRLDEFSPAELADVAFSLARGLGHDHEAIRAVVGRAAADPAAFGVAALSKLLWACARLSYAADALPSLLEHVVVECTGSPDSAAAVAEISHAAGTLDWADDRLHAAVAAYAGSNPASFDGHGVAKVLAGLVGVGYDDAALFATLADRAAGCARRGELAPPDAARILWAMGEGGIWAPDLLSALSGHMLEPAARLEGFSPSELQLVVRACNKLNFCSAGVAAAAARLTERLLPCLEPLAADDDGRVPGAPWPAGWGPDLSAPPPSTPTPTPHGRGHGGGSALRA